MGGPEKADLPSSVPSGELSDLGRELPAEIYQTLIEGLPDAVLVLEEGGTHYSLSNAAAEGLLGFSREELLALTPLDLRPPEEHPQLATVMDALREHGRWRGEQVLRRKDGSLVATEVAATRLTLGDRVILQDVFRDITERKRVEEAHRFLAEASALLASSLDYETTLATLARLAVPALGDWCTIHRLDDDGSIRRIEMAHADPAKAPLVQALRRYPPAPIAPRSLVSRALRTGKSEVIPAVPETYVASIAQDSEHARLLHAMGFTSLLSVPLVARGRTLGAITFASGPPGRRYDPDELLVAEDLANRAALAVDNARLYREAQEAIRMRDQFLGVASHDLRGPLTTITGTAKLLRRGIGRGMAAPARLEQGLRQIEADGIRMATLIQELLDVAQLQAGKPLELKRVAADLVGLAREAVARHQAATRRHHLAVETTVPTLLGVWDVARLERVLDNLLNNAIKYSPEGGAVTVRVERGRRDGQWAVLRVRDRGLGIPATDLPHVFDWFRRGKNVARTIAGTGLGLAGCRQIVQQHGGTIEVESQERAGSTFTICLPLRPTDMSPDRAGLGEEVGPTS